MTIKQIRDVITSADPQARHYDAPAEDGGDYTTWQEISRSSFALDDLHQGGWRFSVWRYTRTEYDPVVDKLTAALDAAEISWRHSVAYDPETRIILHKLDCEAD